MPIPVVRRRHIVLLALGVGLFFTAQPVLMTVAAGRPIDFQRDVLRELAYWLVWALLSPLIIAAAERWPLDSRHGRRSFIIHGVIAVVVAPLQAVLAFWLHLVEMSLAGLIQPGEIGQLLLAQRVLVLWGFFTGVYFYWVVVGLYTALRFRELYSAEQLSVARLDARGSALEAELTRARLDALRSQLHPHFLFNTLNAIAVLAEEDVEKARQMLFRLGSLLRRSLDETQHETPLRRELEFLTEYLDIQRVRFGDRLAITMAIDPGTLDLHVPVFLLQPLVENAIVHGAADPGAATIIAISTAISGDSVTLAVEDNGPGPSGDGPVEEGVGLGNTRQRLHGLYGAAASLTLGHRNGGARSGARVEIRLPVSR